MSVIAFLDHDAQGFTGASLTAVTYGYQLAQAQQLPFYLLSYGKLPDLAVLSEYGGQELFVDAAVEEPDAFVATQLIRSFCAEKSPAHVILPQSAKMRTLAGMLSVHLKAAAVIGALGLPQGDVFKRYAYSGKALAQVKVNTAVKIVGVLKDAMPLQKVDNPKVLQQHSFESKASASLVVIKERKNAGFVGIPLPEAERVVSAGRGLQGPENWGMIEKLAELLNAATACSRPVSDAHWRPHHEHVGQTGITIRPNLYIAIGISGAIQHLAGVNGSKVIVVINKDSEAPFFKFAHYGIVGDAFEVVPKLIAALQG